VQGKGRVSGKNGRTRYQQSEGKTHWRINTRVGWQRRPKNGGSDARLRPRANFCRLLAAQLKHQVAVDRYFDYQSVHNDGFRQVCSLTALPLM